jgi:hypothetical protein
MKKKLKQTNRYQLAITRKPLQGNHSDGRLWHFCDMARRESKDRFQLKSGRPLTVEPLLRPRTSGGVL